MIIGRSGSGKTYSLKSFKPDEVGILSVEKGRLPFRSELKAVRVKNYNDSQHTPAQANAAKYTWLINTIKSAKVKSIVIDDSQYLMAGEFFDRSMERGYDKYTEIGSNFRDLIHSINEHPDDDKIVYFLHHSEEDAEGREKVKTIGKLLDEKLCVEGCFDIVLYCEDHKFYTQSNGQSVAKSPEDMFELEIPNDLKFVDDAIREYYGMAENNKKEKQ